MSQYELERLFKKCLSESGGDIPSGNYKLDVVLGDYKNDAFVRVKQFEFR